MANNVPNWKNNNIQFPRLLSEICASQSIDLGVLADDMDLEISEVIEILDRAQRQWERIKEKYCPIAPQTQKES